MKNVDDFVKKIIYKNSCTLTSCTLKSCVQEYNEINKNIKKLKQEKEYYDNLLNSSSTNSDLTFKEKYAIYKMIEHTILNGEETYRDIDLYYLKAKFVDLYYDLREYLNIIEQIKVLEKAKKTIIHEDITFDCFNSEYYSEHCFEEHCFVVENQELKCIYCGATTKDYPLNKEEFEFLVLCAKEKGILLEDFTKEDWPLLQVIIEEQDYRRSSRPELDMDADDYFDKAEERFYEDEGEFHELEIALQKAHMLDSKIFENEKIKMDNPKYLSDSKKKELLDNLEKELHKIQKTDSRFKSLLIEQCKTAKYEILILSGEHIPTLLQETTDEDEKIALTKAYYNLRDVDFRMNSGYFNSNHRNNDAVFYNCYTANPEINSRILEMKLRRK